MMSVCRVSWCVLITLTLLNCVHALDEASAKEISCFQIKHTVPIQNVTTTDPAYYPLMSRLELYRFAKGITKRDFKDIGEDELYYEGCIRFPIPPEGTCCDFTSTGFHGQILKQTVKVLDPGMEQYEFEDKDGWHGHCYITLSEKNFAFQACCSNGNQMHWGVMSSEKVLSKENVKLIHDHAESLGFKREYFTGLRYDYCDN